jgi:hypothetical protein
MVAFSAVTLPCSPCNPLFTAVFTAVMLLPIFVSTYGMEAAGGGDGGSGGDGGLEHAGNGPSLGQMFAPPGLGIGTVPHRPLPYKALPNKRRPAQVWG